MPRPNGNDRVPRSIGFRVAVAVNAVMAVAVSGFLVLDYQREVRQRLADKAVALGEEALTIHQGVTRLRAAPAGGIQEFIDEVCGRMTDSDSPGHHIVADIDGRVFQARAHHRASAEVYQAVLSGARDPRHRGTYQGRELVIGTHREGDVTVYVAEELANVLREVRAQVLVRSLGILGAGLVLAAAVNVIIRRLVTRPLKRLVRTIGEIGAGKLGAQAERSRSAELDYLADAINQMSQSLAAAEGRRQVAIAKARRIQQNLLPRAGAVAGLDLAALHRAAEEVAGDYYDVVPLPGGACLLVVADVVGHGVPAAMSAAMLKILLLQAAQRHAQPGEMLRAVNRGFMAVSLPDDFATLFVAHWEPADRRLAYASAGHEPGLLAAAGEPLVRLGPTGPLLGILEEAAWETQVVPVARDDALLVFTDGVVEAMNAAGEAFGRSRLEGLLDRHRTAPSQVLVEALDLALQGHWSGQRPSDDYTLVAVKFA